jgi:plasmid stabilization system protein ParE
LKTDYKIYITKSAQDDFRETYKRISEDLTNPEPVGEFVNHMKAAVRVLETDPILYEIVRDDYLEYKGLRMFVSKQSLVFFVVSEDADIVSIIRILDARKDWRRMLKVNFVQAFVDEHYPYAHKARKERKGLSFVKKPKAPL